MCVLLAVCCDMIVAARPAEANPADETSPEVRIPAADQQSFVLPTGHGSHHVVKWQARTNGTGGEFRLYHGENSASLQLAAVEQANHGENNYQVLAPTPGGPPPYFELRYISQEGIEVVLVSAHIHKHRYQNWPETQAEPGRNGSDAVVYRPWFAALSTELGHGPILLPERSLPGPEPETPPPRHTRSFDIGL